MADRRCLVKAAADARSVAKLCGVELVVAYDLRDVVAGWEA